MPPNRQSRRRFVQTIGSAGALGVAGCLGGDDEDDGVEDPLDDGNGSGDGNGNGDDEPADTGADDDEEVPDDLDAAFFHPMWDIPADVQWNSYNPTLGVGDAQEVYQEEFGKYHIGNDEWLPRAVADWSIDEEGMELEVNDELTWTNDEPFTAEDVRTKLVLDIEHWDDRLGDYASAIEAEDESTLIIETDEEVNPNVLETLVLDNWTDAPEELFGEYAERYEDGDEDVQAELNDWGLEPEDSIGLGPFEFADVDSQFLEYHRRDDHPDAEEINFRYFDYAYMPTNESRWQALRTDEVSGVHTLFTEEVIVEEFPDYIEQYLLPGLWGLALIFNHEREPFDQVEVRQAIAHIVDRGFATEASAGPYAMEVETPSGLVDSQYDEWMGDVEDEFNAYEHDLDRASELLEEAGLQEDGGTWVTEDGEPFELSVSVPAGFSDWLAGTEAVVESLQDFGLEAQLDSPDVSTYFGQTYQDSDFDIGTEGWTTGQPYPFFSLNRLLASHDAQNIWGYKEEVTIESVHTGEEETWDLTELVNDLAHTTDEDEERELVQQLAYIVNQELPVLPIQEKFDQSFLNVDLWGIDAPEDNQSLENIKWPQFWYAKNGQLFAKEGAEDMDRPDTDELEDAEEE